MSKESLEELLVAASRLSIDEQRFLLKELLQNSPDYHQLGRIAQERQQFDQAVEYFNKALAVFEKFQMECEATKYYHRRHSIDEEQQPLDQTVKLYEEAIEYFSMALAISEKLGLRHDAVTESSASNHTTAQTSADVDPVEKTRGSMSGLDRETIIWLAEDEELCGY